jgi:hypothetical protein
MGSCRFALGSSTASRFGSQHAHGKIFDFFDFFDSFGPFFKEPC